MTLYTIQNENKWNEFQEIGILKADNNNICCNSWFGSYNWIEYKMHVLLPTSDIECIHPIWAWYKYSDKRKPDLRKSKHLNKGEIGYRIEFKVEDNKVLLTDFSNWHLVLNCSNEDLKLSQSSLNIEPDDDIEAYKQEGWKVKDNKFIYNWDDIIVDKNSDLSYIQATLWYVKMEQVKSVKKFKSR